ncbi:hypothetical protein K505DRAFT_412907 [Melanomma pulvis-pyrius CBS 109.77]|uniref:GET complex, subunit GET2 n=1 Tax=Melanomma pulvis-pyrius CBS 109.77 TaxID=1314802 RepID=A0A6A6XW65_9PLEO|nr:hypothetical protein K505DRAFT_412907 [Melanomma pulvis-pyrius CBS 109.77]
MADSSASVTGAAPAESPAQQQARLRRERRAAKIQAGGADRLKAISSLQGGTHRDVEKDVPVRPNPTAVPSSTADPDEIDISQHHYTPSSGQPRLPSPFAFNGSGAPLPFPAPGTEPDPSQDPMMAILQQMMGNAGGMPGQPGQPGDLPPGLANMFSAMQGGATEPSPDQSSAWIWRLVHSICSLFLAIYIVLQTPFTGSKLSRASPGDQSWTTESSPAETFQHFFYMFATYEVVLQTSRYFIERGQLQGSGFLSSIGQMLPEPYAGYVRVIGRYSVIYSTVVSDAMVVVFVLGAASWWRGDIIS